MHRAELGAPSISLPVRDDGGSSTSGTSPLHMGAQRMVEPTPTHTHITSMPRQPTLNTTYTHRHAHPAPVPRVVVGSHQAPGACIWHQSFGCQNDNLPLCASRSTLLMREARPGPQVFGHPRSHPAKAKPTAKAERRETGRVTPANTLATAAKARASKPWQPGTTDVRHRGHDHA